MAKTSEHLTLTVRRREGDDNLREIGKLSFGDRGQLSLISASPAFRDVLEDIVSAVNALDELRVKVPPPPDAEPGSLYRRSVKRDESDLLDAISEYMDQKYDLVLVPG